MAVERRRSKWAYRFGHQGEVYFKSGFETAAKAEAAEAELRLQLSDTMTFGRMVRRRLEYVQTYCTAQYLRDTRAILRRFTEWDYTPLSLVTKEMITNKIRDLAQELSRNNVNRHIRGLRALFEMAVQDGLILKHPMLGIKFLPVERKPRVVPTPVEIKEVLLKADPEEQAFITVVWQTAARVSEVLRLTCEDVNFEQETVRLWTRKSKGGNKVPRLVLMLPDVKQALRLMLKHRVPKSPWVFTSQEKIRLYPDDPSRWHYEYRRKLITRLTDKFRYHDLRHSAASTMAALGIGIPAIQNVLGHSRPTTTDLY